MAHKNIRPLADVFIAERVGFLFPRNSAKANFSSIATDFRSILLKQARKFRSNPTK
jgi:hypothetical protein